MEGIDIADLATSLLQGQQSTPRLVADAIRLAIMRGQLSPGQVLRQEELARQFGLSRVPVREALRQLEAEGVITSHPHRGAVVTALTPEEIEEVYLIRRSLETTALRLAVPRITEPDLRRAATVWEETDSDSRPNRAAELNWAFHEALYSPARSPRLLGIIKNLNHQALRYNQIFFSSSDLKIESQKEHLQILKACRARDKAGAVSALEMHLSKSCQAIVAHVRHSEGQNHRKQETQRTRKVPK